MIFEKIRDFFIKIFGIERELTREEERKLIETIYNKIKESA